MNRFLLFAIGLIFSQYMVALDPGKQKSDLDEKPGVSDVQTEHYPLWMTNEYYRMGMMFKNRYEDGDYLLAEKCLNRAADNGHGLARFELGNLYEKGYQEIAPNMVKAVRNYLLSAQDGDKNAESRLYALNIARERLPECAVCLNAYPNITFYPCRHRACEKCVPQLNKTCHICRRAISNF